MQCIMIVRPSTLMHKESSLHSHLHQEIHTLLLPPAHTSADRVSDRISNTQHDCPLQVQAHLPWFNYSCIVDKQLWISSWWKIWLRIFCNQCLMEAVSLLKSWFNYAHSQCTLTHRQYNNFTVSSSSPTCNPTYVKGPLHANVPNMCSSRHAVVHHHPPLLYIQWTQSSQHPCSLALTSH